MAIRVELRDETDQLIAPLPDPTGGTFDAAGGFDRFVDSFPFDRIPRGLPVLASVDPSGDTVMPSGVMARLLADCERALSASHDGAERRGLLRLQVLAEVCSRQPGNALHWLQD